MNIELEGICYVLLQTGKTHPISKYMHDLKWYPERGMGLLNLIQYIPYVKSIVTENPWMIACYSRENVRVWKKVGRKYQWVMPNEQTLGASNNMIRMSLLGIGQTIPSCVYDDGKEIKKLIKEFNKGF